MAGRAESLPKNPPSGQDRAREGRMGQERAPVLAHSWQGFAAEIRNPPADPYFGNSPGGTDTAFPKYVSASRLPPSASQFAHHAMIGSQSLAPLGSTGILA